MATRTSVGLYFESSAYWSDDPTTMEVRFPRQQPWPWLFEEVYHSSVTREISVVFHRIGFATLHFSNQFLFNSISEHLENGFVEAISERALQIQYLNALSICVHSASRATSDGHIEPVLATAATLTPISVDGTSTLLDRVTRHGADMFSSQTQNARYRKVPTSTMASASDLFAAIVEHSESKAIETIALLNESITAFKAYNFPLATVTGWSICERLQGLAWRTHYEAHLEAHSLNKESRKFLSGRDFTASVVSAVLEIGGVYTPELRKRIDAARKDRNNWLHSGKKTSSNSAENCIRAAVELIELVLGLEVSLDYSVTLEF